MTRPKTPEGECECGNPRPLRQTGCDSCRAIERLAYRYHPEALRGRQAPPPDAPPDPHHAANYEPTPTEWPRLAMSAELRQRFRYLYGHVLSIYI